MIAKRSCGIRALSASLCTTKTILEILAVCVVAGRALPSDLGGFDRRATCRGDNTWHADELANKLGLQVSEDAWVLIRVDLNLPVGHGVTCTARDRLMVIVLVDFLCSCFQDGNYGLRVVPHEHSQALIEVEQQLHIDLNVEAALASVPLELLSVHSKIVSKSSLGGAVGAISDRKNQLALTDR